ncbi:MAG: A/G-specific adenine glycosylase [Bacillota bacterium]
MKTLDDPKNFAHDLVGWFRENKRDLPFRFDKDPYRIFVSELMLQQTQIDTMIPYYRRFMERFPTVSDLADAHIDEVMELWAGLGYYRRARYLHESAQIIRDEYNGIFPKDLNAIESLKGVGRYTARAIHSIAFNATSPAVDGNVMRVMTRILGYDGDIRKTKHMRAIEETLKPAIKEVNPGDFTESLMEVGALICKKSNPLCEDCPLNRYCFAYKHDKQSDFPVVSRAKAKTEHTYYTFVIENDEGFLLTKRPKRGLLAGLPAFPQYELKSFEEAARAFETDYGIPLDKAESLGTIKHVFSHRVWHMHVIHLKQKGLTHPAIEPKTKTEGLPTAHRKILDHLEK